MTAYNTSPKNDLQEEAVKNTTGVPVRNAAPQKKKHYSALLAAACYRSPVHRVSSDTYFNTGLEDTGIGMGYREWGM